MDYENIKTLLDKYFEGNTSTEEEEDLRIFFESNESVHEELAYARIFFQSIKEERGLKIPIKEKKIKRMPLFLWAGVAASIVFLLAFFVYQSIDYKQIIVKNNDGDKPQKVKVYSGVNVWLNTGSEISYVKKSELGERHIQLQGEAYFEINNDRPVTIISEGVTVACNNAAKVNVKSLFNDDHIIVTVKNGAVKLKGSDSRSGMALLLTEKSYCSINKKHKLMLSAVNTNNNYLAWKTGELTFDNEPMAMVADVLQQYYGIRVLIENKQLAYCEYSGHFKNKSLQQVLRGIQSDLPIAYQELPDGIMLMGESCKSK